MFVLLLACSACGVAPQPESARTVAAFEVPLFNAPDRTEFLAVLGEEAKAAGFHVDATTAEELRQLSEVSPLTINATVWRGKDDDEPIATIIGGPDHPNLACFMFAKSEEPEQTAQFRERVMPRIIQRWPNTRALPVSPIGGIPLHEDLLLTKDGYRVKRQAASKYEFPVSSPLIAG